MNPMVDQVNKIVSNLLVAGHSVQIPTIGSLRVEWRGARKVARRKIEPPCHVVVFVPQQIGYALPETIAREAGVDATVAQDIFERWLTRTLHEGVLTIDGVGVIRNREFVVEPAFDKLLNPRGHTPVVIHSASKHRLVWGIAIVAIVCGVGACGWMLYDRGILRMATPEPVTVAVKADMPVATMPEQVDTLSVAMQPEPVVPTRPEIVGAERLVSGRTYVVLGVFSSEENALRAIKTAKAEDPALECGVYYYGAKFMASIFESDDSSSCSAFIAAGVARYPDVWCYKAK